MGSRWLWALGLLLVLAAGAVYFWMQPRELVAGVSTRILLLGLDEVDGLSRSDTLIVTQVDDQGVVLLSVPRDLRVKLPNGQFGKINAAFAMGAQDGNAHLGGDTARRVVADFLGVDIPYYLVVDFEGFKHVVDQLGGVDIEIETPMNYDDDAQNLHIHFAPGLKTLDGQQALEYARFRDAAGDLRRIQRQQKLIKAILQKQVQSLSTFDQIRSLLEIAFTQIRATNLPLPDLVALARQLQGVDIANTATVSLDGQLTNIDGVSYLEPRIVGTAALVDRWLRREQFLIPSDVRVAVLNGSGQQGLACTLDRQFTQQGFNVLLSANADRLDYPKTYVITNSPEDSKAQLVAKTLGELYPNSAAGQVVFDGIPQIRAYLDASHQACVAVAACNPAAFEAADVVVIAGRDLGYVADRDSLCR